MILRSPTNWLAVVVASVVALPDSSGKWGVAQAQPGLLSSGFYLLESGLTAFTCDERESTTVAPTPLTVPETNNGEAEDRVLSRSRVSCGDADHPCPLVLNSDPVNGLAECGKQYRIANNLATPPRVIHAEVVHLVADIEPTKFGLLANGWRELCPYVCRDGERLCVMTPAECGEDSLPYRPRATRLGQITPGSANIGMVFFPFMCTNCAEEDNQGSFPEEFVSAPLDLIGPMVVDKATTLACMGDRPITYEELAIECGDEENPCIVWSWNSRDDQNSCFDCNRGTFYSSGLDDPNHNVCVGKCTAYSKYFHFQPLGSIAAGPGTLAATPKLWESICPFVCMLAGGYITSNICVLDASECAHGVARSSTLEFDEGEIVIPGSIHASGAHSLVWRNFCADEGTPPPIASSTSGAAAFGWGSARWRLCRRLLSTLGLVFLASASCFVW